MAAALIYDEIVQLLANVLDGMGRLKTRRLGFEDLLAQLIPWQIDAIRLYIRAVDLGYLPPWIEMPELRADDESLLHAWAALASILPGLFPGEIVDIKRRAVGVEALPGGKYKVSIRKKDVDVLLDHAESMVRFMLTKVRPAAVDATGQKTARRRGRRPGPTSTTQARADAQIFDNWQTRRYPRYADLARVMRLTAEQVRTALDRERKRRCRK